MADEIRAEIDTALEILAATRRWDRPSFANLSGHCEGLSEIIIEIGSEDDEDISHVRILGFVGPEKGEFTLLRGFTKQSDAEYGHECTKARERKQKVLKDARRAPEFEN